MLRFIRISCFVILAALVAGVLAAQPSKAEEAGQAFSISPPIVELTADPGQTVNATIKFTNVSGGPLLITTELNDFGAKNEKGEPNIIFDETQSTTYSLKSWIGVAPPLRVESKETKTLRFPIAVPKDAEPGGHYAVIRFTGTPPDVEQNGVALSASIGTLVLLQVSGAIKEEASVVEFNSTTPQFANSGFFENGPIGFVGRIKNDGNVHIKPTGTIEIKNMFGATVSTIRMNGEPSNPKDQPKAILPQSIRRFEQTMPNQWMIGPYTATMTTTYGQGQKTLTASTTFWVVPYKLLIIAVVTAAALFFGIRYGLQRYKAAIIAQAQTGGNQPKPKNKKPKK